jgi:hypothetical protein
VLGAHRRLVVGGAARYRPVLLGDGAGCDAALAARIALRAAAKKVSGWLNRCKVAHGFLWE